MATIFQGTTLSGAVTGKLVRFSGTQTSMLEVDATSSTDSERQYISGALKDQPEYTFEMLFEGTLPTAGTIANLTITFSDASTRAFSAFVRDVGEPSGSLGDTSAQTYSVTVRRLGAAV